jgi:glycosyltransferase involved in cell wall biosynthesis
MRKIRILHIIEQLGVGGAEKQLLGLVQRMDAAEFHSSVCYYHHQPDSLDDQFRERGVRTMLVDKHSMSRWRFFRRLRQTVRAVSPDIVHTWLFSANYWGRWAAVTSGVRHIIASDRLEVRHSGFVCRLTEKLLASRTVRLANSEAVAESMQRYFGLPVEQTRIIYNAVSLPACDGGAARAEIRRELGVPAGEKLVLMVARQREQKNYPMFVRTGRNVCRSRSDVTFVGVGSGDAMEELNSLIDSLGVAGRVRLVGEQPDVHRWLAAADVFCFTTDYEGFPNAVLEAMMAGTPVVSTRFSGVEELLTGPEVGVTVPLNDDKSMAREISRLLDAPECRTRLGSAARALAESSYSWDVLVNTMESLYRELIEQSKMLAEAQ